MATGTPWRAQAWAPWVWRTVAVAALVSRDAGWRGPLSCAASEIADVHESSGSWSSSNLFDNTVTFHVELQRPLAETGCAAAAPQGACSQFRADFLAALSGEIMDVSKERLRVLHVQSDGSTVTDVVCELEAADWTQHGEPTPREAVQELHHWASVGEVRLLDALIVKVGLLDGGGTPSLPSPQPEPAPEPAAPEPGPDSSPEPVPPSPETGPHHDVPDSPHSIFARDSASEAGHPFGAAEYVVVACGLLSAIALLFFALKINDSSGEGAPMRRTETKDQDTAMTPEGKQTPESRDAEANDDAEENPLLKTPSREPSSMGSDPARWTAPGDLGAEHSDTQRLIDDGRAEEV